MVTAQPSRERRNAHRSENHVKVGVTELTLTQAAEVTVEHPATIGLTQKPTRKLELATL
jgi:hypothetical protein